MLKNLLIVISIFLTGLLTAYFVLTPNRTDLPNSVVNADESKDFELISETPSDSSVVKLDSSSETPSDSAVVKPDSSSETPSDSSVVKSDSDHKNRTALVIGNAAYLEGRLSAPVLDAKALAKVLRKLGFKVVEHFNLNLEDMDKAIGEFHQSLSERLGVGLFYYSGHGIQYQNQNYLIPIGASKSLYGAYVLPKQTVAVNEVLEAMNSAGSDVNLVFLDACRTQLNVVKSWAKGEAIPPGMAREAKVPGSLIAYAAAPGKAALDGKNGLNSPYVKHLLEWIQKPSLSISDALTQVRISVMKETKKGRQESQQPEFSNALNEFFYFIRPASSSGVQSAVDEPVVHIQSLVDTCDLHFLEDRAVMAWKCYEKVLQDVPIHKQALAGLSEIEASFVSLIEGALGDRDVNAAQGYLRILGDSSSAKLVKLEGQLASLREEIGAEDQRLEISRLLQVCKAHFDANRLTTGAGGTALGCYQDVLKKYPGNAKALSGLKNIEARYVSWISSALDRGDSGKAKRYLASLGKVNSESPALAALEERISSLALADLELQRIEQERLARQRAAESERQRLEQERRAQQRIEQERLARQRAAESERQQRVEQEKLARQRAKKSYRYSDNGDGTVTDNRSGLDEKCELFWRSNLEKSHAKCRQSSGWSMWT
jgi:hypothetical protein